MLIFFSFEIRKIYMKYILVALRSYMSLHFKIIKRSSFKIGFGQTIDRSNRIMRSLFASKIININYSIKTDPLNF